MVGTFDHIIALLNQKLDGLYLLRRQTDYYQKYNCYMHLKNHTLNVVLIKMHKNNTITTPGTIFYLNAAD